MIGKKGFHRNYADKTAEGDATFDYLASARNARVADAGTFDLHDIVALLREMLIRNMEELERRTVDTKYEYQWNGVHVKTSLKYQLDALRWSEPVEVQAVPDRLMLK